MSLFQDIKDFNMSNYILACPRCHNEIDWNRIAQPDGPGHCFCGATADWIDVTYQYKKKQLVATQAWLCDDEEDPGDEDTDDYFSSIQPRDWGDL
jgi:hypothetical protein